MALVQTLKATALTSSAPTPAGVSGFKMLDSQVAGHLEFHSKPCFLVDKDGFVLKMVDLSTAGSCGFTEAGFFGSIFNADDDETELVAIRQFLPSYHGLMQLAIGGEKLWYLKLENLVSAFAKPSVMDIKIGKRTYDPFADEIKIQRESLKYQYQMELGFRILGSKSYKIKTGKTEFHDKRFGKMLKPDEILPHIASFLDLKNVPERWCIVSKIVAQLEKILAWFSYQKRIKFYSSSILISFDGAKTQYLNDVISDVTVNDVVHSKSDVVPSQKEDVVVKMIDFPHTYIDLKGESCLDQNYIYGLENLIRIFKNLKSN